MSILYISLLDPLLIYEKAEMGEDGFEGALDLFPETFDPKRIQPEFSGVCVCVCVRERERENQSTFVCCKSEKHNVIRALRGLVSQFHQVKGRQNRVLANLVLFCTTKSTIKFSSIHIIHIIYTCVHRQDVGVGLHSGSDPCHY